MPGIDVMALVTILVGAILSVTALNHLTHSDRRYYLLILAGLPLSLIVNRFVKTPAITGLAVLTGVPLRLGPGIPLWFIVAVWLSAPLFEEAVKLLPLAWPASRVFLRDPAHALWAGLALGMGFGLGEAAYLAYGITQSATYSQLPWYAFSGFLVERLMVTFAHAFMTSIAVLGLANGKRGALLGYLLAVGFHGLINLGPILSALRLIPATVASMGTYAVILAAFVVFQKKARGVGNPAKAAAGEVVYFER